MKNALYMYYDKNKQESIIVYANHKYKYMNKTCEELLNEECLKYGASYDTRKVLSKNILSCKRKVPILTSETTRIIFFCVYEHLWISYRKIEDVHTLYQGNIKIIFYDGSELILMQSRRTFHKHMLECEKINTYFDTI